MKNLIIVFLVLIATITHAQEFKSSQSAISNIDSPSKATIFIEYNTITFDNEKKTVVITGEIGNVKLTLKGDPVEEDMLIAIEQQYKVKKYRDIIGLNILYFDGEIVSFEMVYKDGNRKSLSVL